MLDFGSSMFGRGNEYDDDGRLLNSPDFVNRAQTTKLTLTQSHNWTAGGLTDALIFGSDTSAKLTLTTPVWATFVFDMLKKETVRSYLVSADVFAASTSAYVYVYKSDDGSNWTKIDEGENDTGASGAVDLSGGDIKTRYLKFHFTASASGGNTSSIEIFTIQFTI